MEGEIKTARIDQKSTFIYLFFSKNSGYKETKTSIFERGYHNSLLGQVLTIFQARPYTNRNNM